MNDAYSLIFQPAKLGDVPQILAEFEWAESLLAGEMRVGRVYGLSGGALVALAYALARGARLEPQRWGAAHAALSDFAAFLGRARGRDLRSLAPDPRYGVYQLRPLRRWLASRLRAYAGRDDLRLSELPGSLYLCAADQDGLLTLFGPPNDGLQCHYHTVRLGPPQDAPVLEATIAALSTMLSTAPAQVSTHWYRDCRPAIVDAGAIVADLEAGDPRPILRRRPYAPLRPWKPSFVSSSFVMHSQHERNQPLLASYYLDLLGRHRALLADPEGPGGSGTPSASIAAGAEQGAARPVGAERPIGAARPVGAAARARLTTPAPAVVRHVHLPYIGSTEAFTNMRQSVEHKAELLERFQALLAGQLDGFPFDRPANVIYGAGGFSGILGGLVATRAVDAGFARGGGQVQQIYGVSAGVLNGFFHAVQLAAARYADLYRPPAHSALADLEAFIAAIVPGRIARVNRTRRASGVVGPTWDRCKRSCWSGWPPTPARKRRSRSSSTISACRLLWPWPAGMATPTSWGWPARTGGWSLPAGRWRCRRPRWCGRSSPAGA